MTVGKRQQPSTLAEDLRAATREAREALSDLRRERREVEALIRSAGRDAVARLGQTVAEGLNQYHAALAAAIDVAEARVDKRFQTIVDILTGEDRKSRRRGKKTLTQLAHEHVAREGPAAPVGPPPGRSQP